jgi:hypothetical protein
MLITTTNNAQLQLTTNVGLMVNTINNRQQISNHIKLIIDRTNNAQPQHTTNIEQPTTTLD